MSRVVDDRVVEMRFDNRQFESNVQTSISTLAKLKQSLNLSGAAKGLESVDAAARSTNLSGLSNAVDTVQAKFSAMQIVGITALTRITNAAIDTGKRLISALTIDPVRTGFQEYETKIGAIQTIMSNTASKGTTMEDVTKVINELNTYADKTIYNFSEMTRNIGTFTAAGVGLEESASAIQGIANLAAASGSTSQQASTAMYQLSQALAAGTVKLMDWNSVVNAGMGGEKFQNALKATAKEHGVAVDDLIKKHGSFRESLTEGWITADILNETLSKFTVEGAKKYGESMVKSGKWTQEQADALNKEAQAMEDAATKVKTFTQLWDTLKESAQSGWGQTWEILIGDFEEAKETLTKISEVIGGVINRSADARNNLLSIWKAEGGRKDLVDSLFNIIKAISSIVKPIKEAFREIFPPVTVNSLLKFSEGLKNITASMILSSSTADKLKRTFKGLFAIINIVKQVFSAVLKAISPLFKSMGDLGGGILGVTASIGDWLVKLSDLIESSGVLNKVANGVAKVISFLIAIVKGGIDVFKSAANALRPFIETLRSKIAAPGLETFNGLLERVHARLASLAEVAAKAFEGLGNAISQCSFLRVLQAIWEVLKKIGSVIITIFGKLLGTVAGSLSKLNFDSFLDFINTIAISGIAIYIAKFVKGFKDLVDAGVSMKKSFVGILDSVRGCFEAWQTSLKADVLMKVAKAIAILVAAIFVLSLIDSDKLSNALTALFALFTELLTSMAVFTKIGGKVKGVFSTCTAMIAISTAVLILSAALKNISSLNTDELIRGLAGVAGAMLIMVAAVKMLSANSGKAIKGATQMVIFAASIKILASACKDMSSMSWEELAKGLVSVGVLMAAVVLFLNNAKFSARAPLTAIGIVLLATSIKILASACKTFSELSLESLAKGLSAIGALLLEIVVFTKLTGNAKRLVSTGVAMIAIAAAMKIFASAIKDMSTMSLPEIGKGLLAMAGALAAVVLALNLLPKGMISKSLGLIAVAMALSILSFVILKMASMSWEGLGKAGAAIGGLLLMLAGGLHLMKGTLLGSAALVVAAMALLILAPVIAFLGSLSLATIGKGLLALAGAFVVLGVAGLVLGPLLPIILGLGVAIALVGVGMLSFGIGVTALAAGLVALAGAFASSGLIIINGIKAIGIAIIGLIPSLLVAIGQGIIAICDIIAASVSSICGAIKAIILAVCQALNESIPTIMNTLGVLLDALFPFLVEYTPKLVQAVLDILIACLNRISNELPRILKVVGDIIVSILQGLSTQLPRIIQAGADLIAALLTGIGNSIMTVIDAGVDVVVKFLEGIGQNISKILQAGAEFVVTLIQGVYNSVSDVIETGVDIVVSFLEGISKNLNRVVQAGWDLIINFIDGITASINENIPRLMASIKALFKAVINAAVQILTFGIVDLEGCGESLIGGLKKGIESKLSGLWDGVKSGFQTFSDQVKSFFGINSPSKLFAEYGEYLDEGLIVGMNHYAGKVAVSASHIGSTMIGALSNSMNDLDLSPMNSLKDALKNASGIINGSLDINPTIRPVLDLSEIRDGASSIDKMFTNDLSVGILGRVNSINNMMNQRGQNGSIDDVVSELSKLSRKFEGSGDTYYINGITYDDGSNIVEAVETLVRAAKVERRI